MDEFEGHEEDVREGFVKTKLPVVEKMFLFHLPRGTIAILTY